MVLRRATKSLSLGYTSQINICQLAMVLMVKQLSLENLNNPKSNHSRGKLLKDLVELVFFDTLRNLIFTRIIHSFKTANYFNESVKMIGCFGL